MTHVLHGSAVIDAPAAGGKARALARMERGGLPVPAWFVISSHALSGGKAIDLDVRAVIEAAVRALCPDGSPVAVRSSACDEDGTSRSFAGQLESFLNVAPEDVADKALEVSRSAFAPRVLAYRREHGVSGAPAGPAVLVQRMIHPRAAGVAFSADPVSGRRGVAVVSAVAGLGSSLASGESDGDTWRVGRDGTILERHQLERTTPVLSDEEILAVAALARAAERCDGRPQDIEWAVADRLVLLQARPITSLTSLPDPDAPLTVWDNSNIVESYSGVTTPLTFSFARDSYEHVYRHFCRIMGVPETVIAGHDDVFRNMLGFVRGRLYYNLLNWYRMLALLPGYRVNRRFMEQMMGVSEPLPAEVSRTLETGWRRSPTSDAVMVARTLAGLVWNYMTLDRRVAAFRRRLENVLAPPSPALEDRRADELVAHYRDLRRQLLLEWQAPLINDFFAMVFYGLLRRLTSRWVGDADGALQNDLVGGEGGMVSAEPAVRLRELGRLVAEDPGLLELLETGSAEAVMAAFARRERLGRAVREYLDRFGERTINELKLETATLHDDPLPLFRALGALASRISRDPDEEPPGATSGASRRAASRAHVIRALRHTPVRLLLYTWVLRQARRRIRDRENLRLERTRLFGRVRRIFVELGRRLRAQDALDDPRDVFFLEVDEALEFVEGRSTCTDLRMLAALRKREFRRFKKAPAPDERFVTRGLVYRGHEFRRDQPAALQEGEERRGLGCSPGIVRGRVRVVSNPQAVDLSEPAILVAEHTDPGWIMVFPFALGVVVERGSLLSHAAIVARELQIPAIVSVPAATRWLRDGDDVEMDGASGLIRRIGAASTDGAARCA